MSRVKQGARVLQDTIDRMPEWAPTYHLNRQISDARREMGEARWNRLNEEWNA